eukprot:CAMPEP_0204352324 /NCGR_PEP_ID=MMETSP0469-20131031/31806_1 /ASSEMBLY_ACC=CAM_ASM_000384 /TAXON_ID=2969 /ORGANISM="Oxyrrhis marina" /LENGTH=96 /DNA_ID=CAMNT_0051339039 /DNA_START=22 /DNA_END=309 /DNA_ORIENTATION=-
MTNTCDQDHPITQFLQDVLYRSGQLLGHLAPTGDDDSGWGTYQGWAGRLVAKVEQEDLDIFQADLWLCAEPFFLCGMLIAGRPRPRVPAIHHIDLA